MTGKGIELLFKRAISRIFGLLFEYPNIQLMNMVMKSLKKEWGYDLLISIAVPYPIHWGVAKVYNKNSKIAKTWVADCGDPYMGDRTDSFRKLFYFKYVEKWFSRRADYITIPIEEARKAYYKEFQSKIIVIPQGIRFEDYSVNLAPYRPNKSITFCYAGSFIKDNRDPRRFINYLLDLDVEFYFHIYTNTKELIAESVGRSNGRIIVKDYVPRNELINRMARMDFLVNFENNTAVQAPSKLIDYYLALRPVLSIQHDKLNREMILQFLKRNYSQQLPMNNFEKFRIANVVASFLKLAS